MGRVTVTCVKEVPFRGQVIRVLKRKGQFGTDYGYTVGKAWGVGQGSVRQALNDAKKAVEEGRA